MKLSTVLAQKGGAVATIGMDQPVSEAVQELARRDIGALVVLDGSSLPCGMLSERDIVRETALTGDVLGQAVSAVMTADVVCGTPDDDVDAILHTMTARHFRHLPVVEDGRLVGIVTIGDLVKAQLTEKAGQVETLQVQLTS
ncbi:MAG: CBS domain-containing protein [Dehalococcoidia bacterium]|nr:CBS domain-containing protein [Dehalococcoidia bacterium]